MFSIGITDRPGQTKNNLIIKKIINKNKTFVENGVITIQSEPAI